MSKEKQEARSPRKAKNSAANLARHEANVKRVAELGIPASTSEHVQIRNGAKGPYEVTVTKRVRESKALRKFDRETARLIAGTV